MFSFSNELVTRGIWVLVTLGVELVWSCDGDCCGSSAQDVAKLVSKRNVNFAK